MYRHRLVELMDKRRISVPALAEKTGLDPAGLHRIRRDPYYNMQLLTVGKICTALGISGPRLLVWEPTAKRDADER